jgi:hypothetical protein
VKRLIAACFAGVLILAISAGVASAASPTARIAKLEKQMKALTATVTKQQKTIKTLTNALNATIAVEFCAIGVTADAIQSTWTTLDQAGGTTLFGPQQTISDANLCSALQITRQGIRTPPTVSVFSALTQLLSRKTAAFRLG